MQFQATLFEITQRDSRYPYEAYEFVEDALQYAQKRHNRTADSRNVKEVDGDAQHVNAQDLSRAICELARREFGLLAVTVFRSWCIRTTDDLGEIVYNLIEAGILFQSENDRRDDFHDLFDVEQILSENYEIPTQDVSWGRLRGNR